MILFLLNFPASDSRTVKRGTGFEPVGLARVSPASRRPTGSPQDESVRPADKMAASATAVTTVPRLP
jgi:hypothetical protein